jgi:hypothetical protein
MANPFDSIESAHEYVHLLREQLLEVRQSVGEDISQAESVGATRRLDALRLVDYKLSQLGEHLSVGGRILNDLRALRRLLLGERDEAPSSAPQPLSPASHSVVLEER